MFALCGSACTAQVGGQAVGSTSQAITACQKACIQAYADGIDICENVYGANTDESNLCIAGASSAQTKCLMACCKKKRGHKSHAVQPFGSGDGNGDPGGDTGGDGTGGDGSGDDGSGDDGVCEE